MEREDSVSEVASTMPYPEGPITCCLFCLSKEIHVLKLRYWTVSLSISAVTSTIATVVYLTAFATTGWVKVKKLTSHPPTEELVGLWQQCVAGQCSYTSGDLTGAGFKVSQALAVFSLLFIIIGCVLTYKYCFSLRQNDDKLGKATLCLRFTAFFFLLLLIPVFAMTWDKDHARYSQPIYDGHTAYSFVLVAVTFVLEAAGAFFMYCEVVVIQPTSQKRLLRRPTNERYDGVTNDGFVDITDAGVFPGDVGVTPTVRREERLEDQVVGRLNARAAYENYALAHAQMELPGPGVAGPLCNLGFVPKTAEEIAKRFTGITRGEPEYVPRTASANQRDVPVLAPPTDEPLDDLYDVIPDPRPVQQSVSMQNVYSEDLVLMRSSVDGRLVTSVSMYNISDDLPEIVYDRETTTPDHHDEISTGSWHPELNNIEEDGTLPTTGDGSCEVTTTRHSRPRKAKRKTPVERRVERIPDSRGKGKQRQMTNNSTEKSDQNKPQTAYKKKKRRQHHQQTTEQLDVVQSYQLDGSLRMSTGDNTSVGVHQLSADKRDTCLQGRGLLHGQSTTSLHSLISSASTTIVDGCAETEI